MFLLQQAGDEPKSAGTGTDKDSRMKSENGVPVAPASLGSCICMTQHLGSAR